MTVPSRMIRPIWSGDSSTCLMPHPPGWPTAHGASSRPVIPDPTKACLDVSSIDSVTLSDGNVGEAFRAAPVDRDRYPSARPGRGGADGSSGGPRRERGAGTPTVLRPGQMGGPSHLAAARAGGGLEQLCAAARARQSRRDADLAVRDSAEGLAGELDDDHVLARLACAGWPGRAARHAGHRYPAGWRCVYQAISASGKAVAEDRQIACLLPILLPGRAVSALLPMAGTRRAGLSCGTSGPEAKIRGRVLACVQEVRGYSSAIVICR
jgi:hypothetical protein